MTTGIRRGGGLAVAAMMALAGAAGMNNVTVRGEAQAARASSASAERNIPSQQSYSPSVIRGLLGGRALTLNGCHANDATQSSTAPGSMQRVVANVAQPQNPYGCYNKPRQDQYVARNGYSQLGRTQFINIKDTSSRECRYDLRAGDKRCEGCKK